MVKNTAYLLNVFFNKFIFHFLNAGIVTSLLRINGRRFHVIIFIFMKTYFTLDGLLGTVTYFVANMASWAF